MDGCRKPTAVNYSYRTSYMKSTGFDKEIKNPGPVSGPEGGPGFDFTPEGCGINFNSNGWSVGIMEYWI